MLGECLDMFVCLFQSRNTQFVSFPPFWAHCYKDCVSIMATANCLATAQSLNQPWESQFDLQTLISELRQGRVKYQVVKRWWGGKGEHISTEERTLSPVSACPFTLDLPMFLSPFFTFFSSSISRAFFLLSCKVSIFMSVVPPLCGDRGGGKECLFLLQQTHFICVNSTFIFLIRPLFF